ncbi:penicillin-binding protein 2 [Candidatus Palauibacter soopunensis]|uniref:penicillin-binding protein 2 n=1 Tax=Candidatus Palauibacter soopunensis TaxID=3056739 RepID=UPI002389D9E1|nr:penicillin-binding protein 2 [Candidatus Palauibacter soopunensis]MDE2879781.1 penicillin-binding protein 2 [Candidatus Palauibacter soopunensis]
MNRDNGHRSIRKQRGRWAAGAIFFCLSIVAAGFVNLQIFSTELYTLLSSENRLRTITVPAPRGTIYDRYGRAIADNVPGYDVSMLPGPRDSIAAGLDRLAERLELSPERRAALLSRNRDRPGEALVVRENANFEQVAFIEERRPRFRRVVVDQRPHRRYPAGPAVAHVIGYVGEISPEELTRPEYADYESGQSIGKTGLEEQYEHRLAGRNGIRYAEVNALGSIVRDLGVAQAQAPVPGDDLHLGIDLDLQVYADSVFPEGMRGGVVALDPVTGEVLLLYSHPTFDPNAFIGGIPLDLWNSLREHPDEPMLDRVSMASYPPGSTWKLVMSAIGMKTADLAFDTYHASACTGGLWYHTRRFRCWLPSGHGRLNLSEAIKHSCNVWFYQAGQRIGLDPLLAGVGEFGFGRRTGIDLPSETLGRFPDSRQWYDDYLGPGGWTEAVVWNLSIGQGENAQTLLAMAQFYAALSTGKAPVRPHLVRDEMLAQQRADWTLDLPEVQRRQLVDALVRVVNEPGGTAYGSRLARWTLAGKTGTAQNPHGPPHSWFVGFAPAYNPRIVIAAIVEHGHPDGAPSLAVPLAAGLVNRHLETLGLPPEDTPGIRPTEALPAPAGG